MRIRLLVLVCVPAFLLPIGLGNASVAGHGQAPRKAPRIGSGHYSSTDGELTLDVDVKARRVAFTFRILCRDPFGGQYVSSGPEPVVGHLSGNRLGARVAMGESYERPPESGVGTQLANWNMRGHFTSPTVFKGQMEVEAGTFTRAVSARPQCLNEGVRIRLGREP